MNKNLDNKFVPSFHRSNQFLVRFPEYFNIPEWAVISTNRPKEMEQLKINIAEYYNLSNKKFNTLKNVMNNIGIKNEKIKIDMLDETGMVLYSIIYNNIYISSYHLNDLKYDSDENSYITLKINYDGMEYSF